MFVHAIVYTFMRLLIRRQMLPTKATEIGFHEQWWFLSIFVIYKISSRKTTTTTKNKKGKNKTYLKFKQNTLKNWFHILRNKFLVICMNFDTYLWFSPISIYFLVFFFSGKPVLDSKSGVPVFKCNCMFFPPNLKASLSVWVWKNCWGHILARQIIAWQTTRFVSFRWVFTACICHDIFRDTSLETSKKLHKKDTWNLFFFYFEIYAIQTTNIYLYIWFHLVLCDYFLKMYLWFGTHCQRFQSPLIIIQRSTLMIIY